MARDGVRYRALRPADYDEVLKLWKREPQGVGLSESDGRAGIRTFIKRNPGLSLVALKEEKNVGTVLCGHDGRRGCLYHVMVSPKLRGQGMGREMVERCLESLRKEGVLKCNLFFYAKNKAGRAFWKKLGFEPRDDLRTAQRTLL